jgi:hypothetical protein
VGTYFDVIVVAALTRSDMLVYVRDTYLNEVVAPITQIPEQLKRVIEMEKKRKEQRRREREEEQQWTEVKARHCNSSVAVTVSVTASVTVPVADATQICTEKDLRKHSGFDLVDFEKVQPMRARRTWTLIEFKARVCDCECFGVCDYSASACNVCLFWYHADSFRRSTFTD